MNEIDWKPIESAPHDGTIVLVCCDHENLYHPESAYYGFYHPNSKGKPEWRSCSNLTKIRVTHWTELPLRPNGEPGKQTHWRNED